MKIKRIIREKVFPIDANNYSKKVYINLLLNNAICRSSVAALIRRVDPKLTETWEFSGFSQNGEDGIIDYLIFGLKNSNKYFIEIGSGDGLENNTSYLGHIKKFSGLQVEGNNNSYNDANLIKPWLVENINCFVNTSNVKEIFGKSLFKDPDVFSIDIDGMDYYITKQFLEMGLRPKIIVVEYNSAFGFEKCITLPYKEHFNMYKTKFPFLYYGVSLQGWKKLFKNFGYQFLTVDTNGINAFFIQKDEFLNNFIEGVNGIEFKENIHQLRTFRKNFTEQFEMIKNLPFYET